MLAAAFGAAGEAAADVRLGHQVRAAGQDEVLQRADFLVPGIDGLLQAGDLHGVQGLVLGHRQFPAEVEQAVLAGREQLEDFRQSRMHGLLFGQLGEQQAELAVQRVDLTHRLDARVVLGHPAAVGQAGFAGIAGAGIDLRQAVTHVQLLWRGKRQGSGWSVRRQSTAGQMAAQAPFEGLQVRQRELPARGLAAGVAEQVGDLGTPAGGDILIHG
ncbi:hypothetical protein D3C81_1379400 [compost metagenome]